MAKRKFICARAVWMKKRKGKKLTKEEKKVMKGINAIKKKYC